MATFSKPTIVPNWATTSGNVSVPSAGRRNDGWASTEKPPSDIENWNKRTTGEWLEWIDERLADGTTADELVILSPATANEMLKLSNAIAKWSSAAGIEWESVAGIFTAGRSVTDGINLKGIGNVKDIEFDGTLNRMSYDVSTDIWSLFNNSATASLTVSETLISLKKPVTLDADDDVTVSGTGEYKHGDAKSSFHVFACPSTGSFTYDISGGQIIFSDALINAVLPFSLPVGKQIKSILYNGFGATGGVKILSCFYVTTASGATTPVFTAVNESTNGIFANNVTGINHTIVSGRKYFMQMRSVANLDRWAGAEITYDHP